MNQLFSIATVRHQDGERLPILLDANRQPITWANEYILYVRGTWTKVLEPVMFPRREITGLCACSRGIAASWAQSRLLAESVTWRHKRAELQKEIT